MSRERVNNICSTAIVFRADNPAEVFIEVKDDGYPQKVFRRCLCVIGGNWIGEAARGDRNTLATLRREVGEELSLQKATAQTVELSLLGFESEKSFYQTPRSDINPTADQITCLEDLKRVISEMATPFGDFRNTIPKEVLDRGDPANTKEGYVALASYWACPLPEQWWQALCGLQTAFGNLSNESITLVASVGRIVEAGTKTAFGHDHALRAFFLAFGLEKARRFPMVEGVTSEYLHPPLPSYQDYLQKYDVVRRPVV